MMIRFSPFAEFQSVGAARNVSSSFPIALGPRLERGKFAQSLLDVLTLLFGAFFIALLLGGVGWAFFTLGYAAF
jgi:hypothetical protein